jgi:hypothetical protein
MTLRADLAHVAASLFLAGIASACSPAAGSSCTSAGGTCVLGGNQCSKQAATSNQDCNPTENPGGAFCCLDDATTCTDANVQLIEASNYDQSCKTDSDCIAVGEGNACYACVIECTSAAINISAHAQYLADVANTTGGSQSGVTCGCPIAFTPCCRGGTCHADFACQNPDAATDTGVE